MEWKHKLSGIEKVLGTAVNKEDPADSLLGHERVHHYWFLWNRCDFIECFKVPTHLAKITLLIESHLYILKNN